MQTLQPSATLQGGKYIIKKVLGQGGFGITYLAENIMLEGKVAIKEFFFKEYCDRDEATSHVTIGTSGNRELVERFKQKFIKEARTIFKLNHPNIVRILDIFEENGTAYYVMDYIEGESLGDMVKRRGAIPEAEAVGYIKEVSSALSYIHGKCINHLDIKPSNIMKRQEDGQILLIDFGVSKQYDAETAEGTSTTPVGISHGYSPIEQYRINGVQTFSPQSDVYALAATLFRLITGQNPPDAQTLIEDDLPTINASASVENAIQQAMQVKRSNRPQSIAAWMQLLDSSSKSTADDESTQVLQSVWQEELRKKAQEEKERKEKEVEEHRQAENKRHAEEEERFARQRREQKLATKKSFSKALYVVLCIIAVILSIVYFSSNNSSASYSNHSNKQNTTHEHYIDQIAQIGEHTSSFEDTDNSSIINSENTESLSQSSYLPDVVDMGVSVLWAKWDFGANYEGEKGTNIHWGTLSADESAIKSLKSFPKNISKTKYDIFYEKYGKDWRLPSRKDFEELVANCDYYRQSNNGINGYLLVSKINKNTLFLPNYKRAQNEPKNGLFKDEDAPVYWTADCVPSWNGAVLFDFGNFINSRSSYRPSLFLSVRAVKDK